MKAEDRPGTAIIFPGMGPSQFADVAKFMLLNPFARKLVATAGETLGYDLLARYRASESDYSEYAQVAFLVNCVALAQWAEAELDGRPELIAGPSFGSKAAAVHSGSLDFAEAVWATAQMARCEDEYFAVEHRDIVTHSFTRTPQARLAEVLAELDEQGEWYDISCYIDEDFYMLSLREGRVDWLQDRLRAMGGLPLYTMNPPMHSSAFGALRDRVEAEVVDRLTFADPVLPIVADQDGSVLTTGAGVRTMILDGYVKPVRWPAVVETFRRLGIGTVQVSGPDGLFGRVGATTRNFEVVPVNPRTAMQPRRRVPA
ncbi:ACP S-malonyltransferase [Kitasatospora sp. P5_F3]